MPDPTCAKCKGRMEPGFILELRDSNQKGVSEWIEGEPQKAWFSSLKITGKRRLPIRTQRCTRCGFLESYAAG